MIRENVERILGELPPGVELMAAAKSQPPERILEAIEAGVRTIGENYVQEAEAHFAAIGAKAKWHFIGRLQTNKAKKAVGIFDMIETVDSIDLAREIDKRCRASGKTMPVLVEINSGEEEQKAGVQPADAETLIREIAPLPNVKVRGLMTMGPFEGDPENSRPYFRMTRQVFEQIKRRAIPGVDMTVLSMGMTNSYRVALEEGANMIRIGTKIFGPRTG
ncbi:MAG: YggS family pyridoxal phosphate-dependent enzyme [Candidatus Aminicenantes bacterium]|nr:YggS family pyridoxal phosphate-dependent enzyme [Candidatus Aminicenantes bacterium]